VDYAFAPGGTPYDRLARQLFRNRPNTRLLYSRSLMTVAGFLHYLDTTSGITLPAGDLFIISHGNDHARMVIPLDPTQFLPDHTEPTTYETAEAAVTSGSVNIPNDVNHDSTGTLTSMSLNIRGCRIGAAEPFVDKLKEAFGDESPVTAPKHFHWVYTFGGLGMFEWLKYSFKIVSKDPLANKAAVAAALDAEGFPYRDNTTVPTALWTDWVPKNISLGQRDTKKVYLDLGRTLGKQTRLRDWIGFRHDTPLFTQPISGLTALPPKGDQIDTLRQKLKDDANNQGSVWASSHPLPMYERFDHSSIDDFVDNMNWSFSWDAKHSLMVCVGYQHQYTVLVPITDPPDLTTGQLIYNFYPPASSSLTAVDELLTSDDTMFYTA
jgi:hypothetical protein